MSDTALIQGWLDDIERALRDVFTTSSDEDEAFDNATKSLDALREHLGSADEPPASDPRPDPRTHPEHWTE